MTETAPRLIAILTCEKIEPDDAGKLSLIRVYDRGFTSRFPSIVEYQIYVKYEASEEHVMTFVLRDAVSKSELLRSKPYPRSGGPEFSFTDSLKVTFESSGSIEKRGGR